MIGTLVEHTFSEERIDLEALETRLRDAMQHVSRHILQGVLRASSDFHAGHPPDCAQGHTLRAAGERSKRLMTVFGPVELHRPYYYDEACRRGCCPADAMLDVEGTMFSPGVRTMMAYVGAKGPFREGEEDLSRLAGLTVPAKSIERVCEVLGAKAEAYRRQCMANDDVRHANAENTIPTLVVEYDGTGVPVLKRETVGRKGKGPQGESKTREMKVGCVFTHTCLDENGYPVRDEASTSYVAACESAEIFQWRILHEAQVRGLDRARRVCVIGDGAPWIWNIAEEQFPGAQEIVDLFHARQHYTAIGKLWYPEGSPELERWKRNREKELDKGDVSAVIGALSRLNSQSKSMLKLRDNAIAYFRTNRDRMRYAHFRSAGMFVGSGVIEAGCKTLVGKRLKQSGMHWTVASADNIVALRCLFLSNRWEDFSEYLAAA
jgi:hypothetical protein